MRAVDGILHGVLCLELPIIAVEGAPVFFPLLIIADKIAEHANEKILVLVDQKSLICRPGGPTAVFMFVVRLAVRAAEPIHQVSVQVALVVNPPALADMMPNGATDRVLVGEKLGYGHVVGHLLDVLAIGPPAIIIDFLDVLVRALKQWNILLHPFPGLRIGNEVDHVLIFHDVEVVNVMLEIIGFQD